MDGAVVGEHRGFPFYTIGQRRGLGVYRPDPLYVTGIDRQNNRIEIGKEDKLYKSGLIARNVNMQKYSGCTSPMRANVRIRYKDSGGMATIQQSEDGRVRVLFDEKRRAITPGQSAVFYEGEDVVGGGVIDEVIQ